MLFVKKKFNLKTFEQLLLLGAIIIFKRKFFDYFSKNVRDFITSEMSYLVLEYYLPQFSLHVFQ